MAPTPRFNALLAAVALGLLLPAFPAKATLATPVKTKNVVTENGIRFIMLERSGTRGGREYDVIFPSSPDEAIARQIRKWQQDCGPRMEIEEDMGGQCSVTITPKSARTGFLTLEVEFYTYQEGMASWQGTTQQAHFQKVGDRYQALPAERILDHNGKCQERIGAVMRRRAGEMRPADQPPNPKDFTAKQMFNHMSLSEIGQNTLTFTHELSGHRGFEYITLPDKAFGECLLIQ